MIEIYITYIYIELHIIIHMYIYIPCLRDMYDQIHTYFILCFWIHCFFFPQKPLGPERASQLKKGGVVQRSPKKPNENKSNFSQNSNQSSIQNISNQFQLHLTALFDEISLPSSTARRCGSQFLDNVLADVVGPASDPAQAQCVLRQDRVHSDQLKQVTYIFYIIAVLIDIYIL